MRYALLTLMLSCSIVSLSTLAALDPKGEALVAERIAPVARVTIQSDAPAPAAAADAPDGQKIYDTTCAACHGSGVMGAPKLGDKAAWAPRIKQGADTLYSHAIKGFNSMPAKGGNAAYTDADVQAAVDYMVSNAK